MILDETYCSAGGLTARPASSSSRSPGWSSELPHCSFCLHHLGDDPPKHLSIVELKSSGTFSAHSSQNQQHFFQEAERNRRICIRCCFLWRRRFIVDKRSEPKENVYLEETQVSLPTIKREGRSVSTSEFSWLFLKATQKRSHCVFHNWTIFFQFNSILSVSSGQEKGECEQLWIQKAKHAAFYRGNRPPRTLTFDPTVAGLQHKRMGCSLVTSRRLTYSGSLSFTAEH